ncbi:hypothetical protein PV325_012417 [Microctonus aethiopoides]|nr:hypothetical protein PV325_012417 [Microctonus aethiopoides]
MIDRPHKQKIYTESSTSSSDKGIDGIVLDEVERMTSVRKQPMRSGSSHCVAGFCGSVYLQASQHWWISHNCHVEYRYPDAGVRKFTVPTKAKLGQMEIAISAWFSVESSGVEDRN